VRPRARGFTTVFVPEGKWNNSNAANGILLAGAEGAGIEQGPTETYSRWGGFMDAAFGWGNREPSLQEDAFDFEGTEVTIGIDYRLRDWVTLGAILGYTDQEVDFDEAASSLIVVDGGVKTSGISIMSFGVFGWGPIYGDFSIGYQTLDFDSDRRIKYPSLNPDLDGVNEQSLSESEADVLTATLGFGYALAIGAFSIDPYFTGTYRDSTIDQFAEAQSISLSDGGTANFNLIIAEQDFESLETRVGARLAYVFTPSFGTLVPMVDVSWHAELKDDPRLIQATYGTLTSVQPSQLFNVFTEGRDSSWYTWSLGISSVILGGRQSAPGGRIRGGLHAWVKYTAVEQYEFYDQHLIAGGLRYEF
jgi:outer membrane autotransporter protein